MPRLLERLKIREVSAVDRGAGEGVRVMLMKRHEPAEPQTADQLYDLAKVDELGEPVVTYLKRDFTADQRREATASGAAMPGGGYPIENGEDLENAIHAVGRGKASHASIRRHIATRASALGLTDKLPPDWKKTKKGWLRSMLEAIGVAKAADFEDALEAVEIGEYADAMMSEFSEALGALQQSVWSIVNDAAVGDKRAALAATMDQFKTHVQGCMTEDMEKAMCGAALAAAGYGLSDQGEIIKRNDDMTETPEQMAKRLGDENAVLKRSLAVATMIPDDKAFYDTLAKADQDNFADMSADDRAKARKKNPPTDADVDKRVEAEVAKRLATDPTIVALRKQVTDLTTAGELTAFNKRAADMGIGEQHGVTLQKAYAGDKEAIDKLLELTKGLSAQVKEGQLFGEFGKRGDNPGGGTPHDEVMAKAHELRKVQPDLTIEQAYAKVYEDPANLELAKRDTQHRRAGLHA